jgi:hypothetical protein
MAITAEQKKFLKKYISELDEILKMDDVNELLLAIDNAILDTFDGNGNPNADGIELQNIFNDIYANL